MSHIYGILFLIMLNKTQTTQSKTPKTKDTRKKFKMPSALSIIIGVIFFAILVTWIIHFVDPQSTWFRNDAKLKVPKFHADKWFNFNKSDWFVSKTGMYGVFDALKAGVAGVFDSLQVIFYILAIATLVEVLLKIGALEAGVASLVKGLKNKEIILVPVLYILFALGGTLYGMQEETLGLIPVVVPILIIAGFDAATAYLVVVLGTTTGLASSILDPFSIGAMSSSLHTVGVDASIGTGIVWRIVLFIIYTSLGVLFITHYARKVKKDETNSIQSIEEINDNKIWATNKLGEVNSAKPLNKKQGFALTIFGLTFALMIFSLLPWSEWFKSLEKSNQWKTFSSFFFNNVIIGQWLFIELGTIFTFSVILIAWLFKMPGSKLFKLFKNAFKDMTGVMLILMASRTVGIILTYSGATTTMGETLFKDIGSFGALGITIVLFPLFSLMAVFIPSTTGLASITGPLIGTFIKELPLNEQHLASVGVLAVYPLAQGIINMFVPTTGLVLTQAEASRVNFAKIMPKSATFAGILAIVGISIIALIIGLKIV